MPMLPFAPLIVVLQSTAAAVPAPPPAAQAEPVAADASQVAAGAAGDIVVTARRREESVQDVPIAMSVLSGASLANAGAFNVSRLQQLQPALQFYSSNPRNTAINIRGLGVPFGLTNDGIEQGVGFYVDQVYIGRVGASTLDFVDVDQVEVLRGPQGTLYGKNTTAGAINITTRKPSFTPEARVELTGGNLKFFQAKGSVSGPLSGDTVAARLSASLTTRRGTIYDVTSREWINSQDNIGLRGQVLIRPAGNVDVTLSGDFNLQDPTCCAQIFARVGATQRPLTRQYAALAAAFNYAPPSTDAFDRVTDIDAKLRARQEIGGVSAVVNWDLGPATLTSVTAWRYWDWKPSNDRDFIGLPITTVSQNPSQQKQVSQELRLASNGRNTLDYTLGAFFFHQTIDTQGAQVQGAAASRYLLNPGNVPPGSSGCSPVTANACNPSVLDGLTATNTIGFSNTSLALFGKLNWAATDAFHVQPGLRLNYDRKSGSYLSVVTTGTGSTTLNNDQRGVLAPQSYAPRFSDWNVSGDLTLSYDFAADVHGYATYARSFKSGGINLSGLPLDAANNPILSSATVKPETVNHYELGLKTQFAGRRATLNLAAFWTDIGDYQATVTNGQLGVIRGYLANARKVRVRGAEFDTSFRPDDHYTLYAAGAFTDAKYVDFKDAPCPPELQGGTAIAAGQTPSAPGTPGGISPANCDISGQWLPGISRWSFSFGGEVHAPAGPIGAPGELYVGYDGSYRSRFSSNPSRSLYTDIGGYSLSNLRAGYRDTATGLNAFAWVRNLFDKDYYELLATQSGSTGLVVGQPGDPRTYGFTLAKSF